MKILRKCGIILFLILLFSLCFSLEVQGYTFSVDGTEYSQLRGNDGALGDLENYLKGHNRVTKKVSVMDLDASGSTVEVGSLYAISLGGVTIYADKEEELTKFADASYNDFYIAVSGSKIRKISSTTDSNDVPVDTIIDAKTKNLVDAFADYMKGDLSTKMEISQDLGIASATAGSNTGLRWWGLNYENIVNTEYMKNDLATSQKLYITSDVPAISGGTPYGGGVKYYIIVPNGFATVGPEYKAVNEVVIKNTAQFVTGSPDSLKSYKQGVKEGLIKATIEYGYNITSFKAAKPTQVDSIVKEENGKKVVKTNSDVKYAFSYFMHPGYGKMEFNVPKTEQEWLSPEGEPMKRLVNVTTASGSVSKINANQGLGMMEALNASGSGTGALYFVPNPEFIVFRKAVNSGTSTFFAKASSESEKDKDNCVVPIRAGAPNNIETIVDCCVPITVPAMYEKGTGGGFVLAEAMPALLAFEGYSYNLVNDNIYLDNGGNDRTSVGTLTGMYTTSKDVYLYNVSFKEDAAYGHAGKDDSSGCVVFTTFLEALVNPDDTDSSSKILTGRVVNFKKDALSKITLKDKNYATVKPVNSGTEKETVLQHYAFAGGFDDVNTINAHDVIAGDADSVRFHYDIWSNTNSTGVSNFGIRIFRNNKYVANDTDLLNWAKGEEIKSVSFADPDTLLDWIQGKLQTADQLSYTEWQYLQDVKDFLEDDKIQDSKKFFTVPVVIFGIFIIIYGILIVLAYLIDIFNNFFDFSILYFLTFKRVFPVASKTELEYINKKDGVKYVTFRWVYTTFSLCVIIGFLFVNYVWVLGFFSSIFYTVREFMNSVF